MEGWNEMGKRMVNISKLNQLPIFIFDLQRKKLSKLPVVSL